MNRIKDFFRTFLLFELLKGMMLTGRYMFARKITVHFPEEKTPLSPRFRGPCTRCAVTRMEKSAASHASFARRYVPRLPLRLNPSSARTAPAVPRDMISTLRNAYSVDSARNPVPSIRLSRPEFWNITARSVATSSIPRRCCWRSETGMRKRSRRTGQRTRATARPGHRGSGRSFFRSGTGLIAGTRGIFTIYAVACGMSD